MNKEYTCDCNTIHHETVKKVKQKMINKETLDKTATFFKILSDPTRLKIICALDNNEMCVCDIANVLEMTKSAISHQLSILKSNNLVKHRKQGKEVYYTLEDDHVKEVFEVALTHIKHKEEKWKNINIISAT